MPKLEEPPSFKEFLQDHFFRKNNSTLYQADPESVNAMIAELSSVVGGGHCSDDLMIGGYEAEEGEDPLRLALSSSSSSSLSSSDGDGEETDYQHYSYAYASASVTYPLVDGLEYEIPPPEEDDDEALRMPGKDDSGGVVNNNHNRPMASEYYVPTKER